MWCHSEKQNEQLQVSSLKAFDACRDDMWCLFTWTFKGRYNNLLAWHLSS